MDRDLANEQTQAAQDAYTLVRQQYELNREEAEPHRAKRRQLREAVNSLQVLSETPSGCCQQYQLAQGHGPHDLGLRVSGFSGFWDTLPHGIVAL